MTWPLLSLKVATVKWVETTAKFAIWNPSIDFDGVVEKSAIVNLDNAGSVTVKYPTIDCCKIVIKGAVTNECIAFISYMDGTSIDVSFIMLESAIFDNYSAPVSTFNNSSLFIGPIECKIDTSNDTSTTFIQK